MEKSKRKRLSSDQYRDKREELNGPDQSKHKHRHALRAPAPQARESRSLTPIHAKKAELVTSWLSQAYPYRDRRPDLEDDRRPPLVREERRTKRPRSPSDGEPASVENRKEKGRAFEKRPRHKPRQDKYEYKDGPDPDIPQPKGRKRSDKSGQQQHDREQEAPLNRHQRPPSRIQKHQRPAKSGAQRGDFEKANVESLSDHQKKPTRARRSGRIHVQSKELDKDLQEISGFFDRKTAGSKFQDPPRRKSRNLRELDDLSEPTSIRRSATADIHDAPRRNSHHPDTSRTQKHASRTRSLSSSTRYFTWSASEGIPNTREEHKSPSELVTDDPLERTRTRGRRATESHRKGKQEPLPTPRRERKRHSASRNRHDPASEQEVEQSPLSQYDSMENMPLRDCSNQYSRYQAAPIVERRVRFDDDQPLNSWASRPPVDNWSPERLQMPTGTEVLYLRHGNEENWQPGTRLLDDRTRPSNADLNYYPRLMSTNLGPVSERHSLGIANTREVPVFPPERLATPYRPDNYGYASLGHVGGVPSFYTGPRSQPVLLQSSQPMASHELAPYPTIRPSHPDQYNAESKRQSKRKKREHYIERLEQETMGVLKPAQDPACLEIGTEGAAEIPPTEPGPFFQSQLEDGQAMAESKDWSTSEVPVLPHLSAALLPPTHGFSLLPPPGTPVPQGPHFVKRQENLGNTWQ